ncbi:Predicted Zn-dependent proteases and their inactivated homologs [Chromobacterium violaceum]|uniref:Predicted Zn-dependent proteases and their inactivated homologs n=1 Tax=Chromobacterium violaceum TaxID=536 RepID=A0A3S4IH78_CHRVL|nr:Predicted Zn-dependent proteases and their inactivated homologs [Chromobacterium violaceum]
MRAALEQVQDDPFLLLNQRPSSTERIAAGALPPAESMVADILAAAEGLDLVGILACGEMSFGFANHLGQFNWQQGESWNFDWSLYSHGDKAVKRSQAGSAWDAGVIRRGIAEAAEQLALLKLPLKMLAPGEYRAYFTPTALAACCPC